MGISQGKFWNCNHINNSELLIKLLWSLEADKIANLYAAVSGKIVQNIFVAQCCAQNRQFGTQYQRDRCAPNLRSFLPFQGRKLAWTGNSSMHLHNLPKYESGFVNRGNVYCNGPF